MMPFAKSFSTALCRLGSGKVLLLIKIDADDVCQVNIYINSNLILKRVEVFHKLRGMHLFLVTYILRLYLTIKRRNKSKNIARIANAVPVTLYSRVTVNVEIVLQLSLSLSFS